MTALQRRRLSRFGIALLLVPTVIAAIDLFAMYRSFADHGMPFMQTLRPTNWLLFVFSLAATYAPGVACLLVAKFSTSKTQ